ncbi:MAG TPA: S53 family serine peptidase [Aliidongia sp.]|nr:S53 family serine peptidase [Aliidongia sp.]
MVAVEGNTRPETISGTDLGRISDATEFPHLALQLQRSPEQQKSLDKFLEDVHTPGTAEFHHWLSAAEFGQRFGVADADLTAVKSWLSAHGMTVNSVNANLVMDVSATARQIAEAFHTEIHSLDVKGVKHIANMSDPMVPKALRGVLAGPIGLNDFKPHTLSRPRANYNFMDGTRPLEALVPLDLQTIYNLIPLYAAGYSGQGQTIAVIEDTDLFSNADFSSFRKVLGLSRPYPQGNLTVLHPAPVSGPNNCSDPGVNGDDGEAAIDVEWASAAAPNASIVMISCADTSNAAAGFGGYIGMQNILNGTSFPKIFSISYGESEASNGATSNLFVNNLYALAAAEGVSVFVSSGDEGAASSDANRVSATHGIAVSGWASTPNNVAVGGTDFADTFLATVGNYWNATNGPAFNSAKSYIPEIPWNDSCASQLLAIANGFSSVVGTAGFCNSTLATTNDNFLLTASGSGGPSGCATGTASTRSVVSGTCKGYAKPSWQAGVFGNPADGVRDIPDVALFAANGAWNHYYVVCYSDTNTANTQGDAGPCNNTPSSWAGFGGTSVSSPIMAGIQALVNQRTGEAQGNPDPVYYAIANTEFGTSGNAACNSEAAGGPGTGCVFYDITLGDMDVNCTTNTQTRTLINCFNSGGANGALSVSNTVFQPAYPSTAGWDFPTGIGSVNAYNLVMSSAWPSAPPN